MHAIDAMVIAIKFTDDQPRDEDSGRAGEGREESQRHNGISKKKPVQRKKVGSAGRGRRGLVFKFFMWQTILLV